MFFDSVSSQSATQNTNVSNNVVLGSTGTDLGFNPINDTRTDQRASNDLGFSAGVALGAGSSAMGGAVGMSKQEQEEAVSTYDRFTKPVKEASKSSLVTYALIGFTLLVSAFSLFKQYKTKKA